MPPSSPDARPKKPFLFPERGTSWLSTRGPQRSDSKVSPCWRQLDGNGEADNLPNEVTL